MTCLRREATKRFVLRSVDVEHESTGRFLQALGEKRQSDDVMVVSKATGLFEFCSVTSSTHATILDIIEQDSKCRVVLELLFVLLSTCYIWLLSKNLSLWKLTMHNQCYRSIPPQNEFKHLTVQSSWNISVRWDLISVMTATSPHPAEMKFELVLVESLMWDTEFQTFCEKEVMGLYFCSFLKGRGVAIVQGTSIIHQATTLMREDYCTCT